MRGWPQNLTGFPTAYAFVIAKELGVLPTGTSIDGIGQLCPRHVVSVSP
jgi:hypothetical protein